MQVINDAVVNAVPRRKPFPACCQRVTRIVDGPIIRMSSIFRQANTAIWKLGHHAVQIAREAAARQNGRGLALTTAL